jgi:ABC-type antimicrobial peptide transport system permease subunit
MEVSTGENLLLADILNEKNRVIGNPAGYTGPEDMSLIVSRGFLEEFNYPVDTPFINMRKVVEDSAGNRVVQLVPLPIRAVVNEIPGKNDFIQTLYSYKVFSQQPTTFDLRGKKKIRIFVKGSLDKAQEVKNVIAEFFRSEPQRNLDGDVNKPKAHEASHLEGHDIVITFYPILPYPEVQRVYFKLIQSSAMQPFEESIIRFYDFTPESLKFSNITYDNLSIHFETLDNVRQFANDLEKGEITPGQENMIQVDIAKVKEKENFNFLSKITWIIAYIIVIFGIISISLFISNLLKMHLSKVRMNIGTFKAFGLSNGIARNIYFLIIVRFLVLSLILALGLSVGVGLLLDGWLSGQLMVEQGVSYFKILDIKTYFTLGVLVSFSLAISWFTISRMLSKSPGDLIYNR